MLSDRTQTLNVKSSICKEAFTPNKGKIDKLLVLINNNKNKTASPPSLQENDNTLVADSQPQKHIVAVSASQPKIADSPENANDDTVLPLVITDPLPPTDGTAQEITAHEDPVSEINFTPPPVTADQSNDSELPDAALDAPNETFHNTSPSCTSDNETNEIHENQLAPSNGNEMQNDINTNEHNEERISQSEHGSPSHTQFQDVLNNPDNYEVLSAIEDNDDEEDTDANQVPEVMFTHRNGDTLWFIYPFRGVLKCTECGCNFTTTQKQ